MATSNVSATIASAAANSSGDGGSDLRKRSDTLTQPICRETASKSGSSGPDPATNSVDPPPISTTRNGPSSGSRSATAPDIERDPSSLPVSNSGDTPVASVAVAKNTDPLDASRAADVATRRARTTPKRSLDRKSGV